MGILTASSALPFDRSASAPSDYERALDATYGPGTAEKLRLEARAHQIAEAEYGDSLVRYDHTEWTTTLTGGLITLTVDPLKNELKSISGVKKGELKPGAMTGSIELDFATGEVKPSLGASVGAAKLVLEPDGFRYSIGGIENKFDYRLNHLGGKLEPTVPLGPFSLTAYPDGLVSIGATGMVEAGPFKAETKFKVFYRLDGEGLRQELLDALDWGFQGVNGGLGIDPLFEALEP